MTTVIDHLGPEEKQKLLRLLVEEVRVTGWNVQIQLRIPLDAESQDQPPPNDSPPVSSQDRLRSIRVDHHGSVQETVEKCCSDGGIAKNLPPRTSPPEVTGRLVVMMIEDFRYR